MELFALLLIAAVFASIAICGLAFIILTFSDPLVVLIVLPLTFLLMRYSWRQAGRADQRHAEQRAAEALAEKQQWEREWIPPENWRYQEPIPRPPWEPFE